ncbi:MAG: PRC-barrel domain-containing protein [Pseudomonadota bacterium]
MGIETEENNELIAAAKVEGTSIYSSDGDDMGSVQSVMIEKTSGQVAHAVVSVGGFLGMGSEYHVLPWEKLDYDTELGGYRLNVTEEQLRSGPTVDQSSRDHMPDREYQDRVYNHYGVSPYYA